MTSLDSLEGMSDWKKLFYTIADAIDEASPRHDPSPLDVADAIEAAVMAGTGIPSAEGAAIQVAQAAFVKGWGDWCGGRVEPREVADFMLQRFSMELESA